MKIGKFNVTSDLDETPGRFIIYGQGSVGKSTLACSAPNPIIISIEDGTREFSTLPTLKFDGSGRVAPANYTELLDALTAILAGDVGDRQSLILDGGHQIDELVKEEACRQNPKWKSIQQEGFGKGEAEVLRIWRILVAKLEEINRRKKLRLIMTVHAQPSKFKDPEGPEYMRYDMAVTTHPKGDVAGFLFGWAEVIAFARFEKLTAEIGNDRNRRTIAVAEQGDRLLHLKWTNAYQAKCRLSGAPDSIRLSNEDGSPKSWTEVFGDLEDKTPGRMRAKCASLMAQLPEERRAKWSAWLEKAGDDVPTLARGVERMRGEVVGSDVGVKEEGEAA